MSYDLFMRLLTSLLIAAALSTAQTTLPTNGQETVTIPAGTFENPLTFQPPLARTGNTITCSNCSGGTGGSSGSSGLMPWNPAPSTPPTLSNWTEINGGGNGLFADVTNGVLINSVSGNNNKVLWLPAPSQPFTITAHQNAICQAPSNYVPEYGLFLGDTGTKSIMFGFRGFTGPDVNYWNDPSTSSGFSSQPYSGTPLAQPTDFWQRIKYDGTNFYFQLSGTGADTASWVTVFQAAANTFLTTAPAKMGFYTYSQVTNQPCVSTLNYWYVSEP